MRPTEKCLAAKFVQKNIEKVINLTEKVGSGVTSP